MTRYVLRRWNISIILILIITMNALFKIFSAYMIGSSFNKLLENDLSNFIFYVELSFLGFLLFLLFTVIRVRFENRVIQKIISDIRNDIMSNISKSDYKRFYDREIGTYISWLSNDLLIIEQKGFTSLFSLITVVIETTLSIFALITFHWSIILFTVITSLLTLYLPKLANKRIQESSTVYSESLEQATSKYSNYLNGFDSLLSYKRLGLLKSVAKDASSLIFNTSDSLKKNVSIAVFLGGFSNLLSQIGVLILSGFLISFRIISFGAVLTIGSLTGTIFNSISNILDTMININTVKPILAKFDDYDKEVSNNNDNEGVSIDTIDTLSLRNLGFSYDDKTIIDGFNYTFETGKKYALCGKSGSGKTTLLNILSHRLNDYLGEFNINGIDVKKINKKSVYKNLAYVSQNSYIFSDTLRFNISLGENIDDKEIIKVLKLLDLNILLEENGLDLILKENGKNLSGGQKQRIALARALIRNKKLLLLDEVTSSLDKENASLIENIVLNDKDLTVILISHNITEENKSKFDDIIEFPVSN